jgi:hypothetical protein
MLLFRQFRGLHGQSYQVHGVPGEVFALVSSQQIQVNSMFTYIDNTRTRTRTRCDKHMYTCYAHAGTYLTNTGISVWPKGQTQATHITLIININSNTSDWQMSVITTQQQQQQQQQEQQRQQEELDVNTPSTYMIQDGALVNMNTDNNSNMTTSDVNSNHNYIRIIDSHHITVHVYDHLRITFILSPDGFFDISLSLLEPGLLASGSHRVRIQGSHDMSSPPLYPLFPLHGLIAQSWRNAVYVTEHDGEHYYEGLIDDYIIQDGNLHGSEFAYNQFKQQQQQETLV